MRFILVLLLLVTTNIFPQTGAVGGEYFFSINKFEIPLSNYGFLSRVENLQILSRGCRFNDVPFLFSGGFILNGFTSEMQWANGIASSMLIDNYEPGKVGASHDEDAVLYVITKNDPAFGEAWRDWEKAVELGAEFYDGNKNGIYEPYDLNFNGIWDNDEDSPVIYGTCTIFGVLNDSQPLLQRRRYQSIPPMGIEVRQYVYAFESREKPYSNVFYIDYEFVNKNPDEEDFTDLILSIFSDPDLGQDYTNDLVGYDRDYQAGIIYQHEPGTNIALMISIGCPGYRDSQLSSFVNIPNFSYNLGTPTSMELHRFYQSGLLSYNKPMNPCEYAEGNIPDDCETIDEKFWYSGDPVTGAGWLNIADKDQRVLMNFGPFNLAYGESKRVLVSYIVGEGNTSVDAIKDAREIAKALKGEVEAPEQNEVIYPEGYSLEQNYPNPFNPQTTIRFTLPEDTEVTLKLTNILGKTKYILNNLKLASGTYDYPYDASDLPTGVYFYTLVTEKYRSTKKMLLIR